MFLLLALKIEEIIDAGSKEMITQPIAILIG
jgi:hypothetical protein